MLHDTLRAVNLTPFAFTMRHMHAFSVPTGDVDSPAAWDALRASDPHLSISDDRAEWLAACNLAVVKDGQDAGLVQRAADIVEHMRSRKLTRIFSLGSGGGGLEYHVKRLAPELRVVCSEYAPESVARLRRVFIEADDVVQFDARSGDWRKACPDARTLVLFYRLDPHLTDAEWRAAYEALWSSNVRSVLHLPHGFLTVTATIQRLRQRLRWARSGTPAVFAGYLRSKERFRSFWRGLYTETPGKFGGLAGFALARHGTP